MDGCQEVGVLSGKLLKEGACHSHLWWRLPWLAPLLQTRVHLGDSMKGALFVGFATGGHVVVAAARAWVEVDGLEHVDDVIMVQHMVIVDVKHTEGQVQLRPLVHRAQVPNVDQKVAPRQRVMAMCKAPKDVTCKRCSSIPYRVCGINQKVLSFVCTHSPWDHC